MEIVADYPDAQSWDSYVENHPQGRYCHLFAYRALEGVYGYKPHYFGFLRQDRLVGVLPMFEASSLLFGKRLVSQPFSEYGGFLVDDDWSEPEFRQALEAVEAFAAARGVSELELHGRQGLPAGRWPEHLALSNAQHCAWLALDRPLEALYEQVVTHQVRKAVQKARREGVTAEEASDSETLRRRFFPLYVSSMKRLGTPSHGLRFYLAAKQAFGDKMRIVWAFSQGAPIAGLLGFSCGRRVNIINIVSDERYWELRPNDLVHWEYIEWAHRSGFRVFDFGSIRYEGQLKYKRKWGCTIEEHGYYFPRWNAGRNDYGTFDSSSSAMDRMSHLWAKFVPVPVARAAGPLLRRHLVR